MSEEEWTSKDDEAGRGLRRTAFLSPSAGRAPVQAPDSIQK